MTRCSTCGGSGQVGGPPSRCYSCSGSGTAGNTNSKCLACGGCGTGTTPTRVNCSTCGGTGTVGGSAKEVGAGCLLALLVPLAVLGSVAALLG